ncbi:hypothetical protein [Nonomuraea maritima]|uniref:hypothetical protein n=1 Tax=Nonomuraea maritima TaxID=683260 RepID=UPI00371CDDAD
MPRIDSEAIKPGLWSIAAVWAVFLACVAAGWVLFLRADTAEVAPMRTFASGERVTVPVDPADRPAVYISSDTPVPYDCSVSGGPGQARLAATTGTPPFTADGVTWEQFLVINAPARGDYQLTCTAPEPASVRYGVGPDLLSAGRVSGIPSPPVLLPAAGLLVAVGGTVVVLARRNIVRKRLAISG